MGIPSYFSYIVKNHIEILKRFSKSTFEKRVDHLFMDCNSIIYDAIRSIDFNIVTSGQTKVIIDTVIEKIDVIVNVIGPQKTVYIAFDGVAPVAKMKQQRERRFKSLYTDRIRKHIFKTNKAESWNTTVITPGTQFMTELGETVKNHYATLSTSTNAIPNMNYIVTTSDDCGEGEHKIYEYIRTSEQVGADEVCVVYGLDADLIMLSLLHLPVVNQLYLFRETPEFIKSVNRDLEPNAHYVLDIPALADQIMQLMCDPKKGNSDPNNRLYRVYDYIFLCFFLGNDFMPHFPAVNIRTGGVDKMLLAYKESIGKTPYVLTDGKTIYWKHLRTLVSLLAANEESWLKKEQKQRDRHEKMVLPFETEEQNFRKFELIPTYDRYYEKYIDPFCQGWQDRYYESLFFVKDGDVSHEEKQKFCMGYLEGLEWNMKYYMSGCADWRWKYNYHYPPLLQDLAHFIPYFEHSYFPKSYGSNIKCGPVDPMVQLCYVLPKESHTFLPEKVRTILNTHFSECYPKDDEIEYVWAFCKYFWEAHIMLPEIDINNMERYLENKK
jgi:5'-3' exonuclease